MGKGCENMTGLLHRLKMSWTSVHKRLKIGPEFLSTLCKFSVHLHGQALHREVSKGKSTKLYQMEGGKWRWCEVNKVAPHSECKWNHQNLCHWCPVAGGPKTFLSERSGLCCRNSVCLSDVCRLSIVCRLSSITLVHPTQGVEPFGKIFSLLCTLAILWPPCKNLRRSSQGNPSVGALNVRAVPKYSHFRHIEGYIS